ncbi:hypothetical protein TNCT_130041 [Trichonephila clavata]|uniref:Uncharacterized protein n=1 Tax=Trichonephila clavata TaxID=2740835 RepID=A0A8X6I5K2_TRICU|nr:hypothetical protein TNCT_130041 [Trichonephila clavata]
MDPPMEMPEVDEMEERTLEQACLHLSHLWCEARKRENSLNFFRKSLETATEPPCLREEQIEKFRQEIPVLEDELQTLLGEIALVTCPIVNCPTHTFRIDQNAETNTAIASKVKPKEDIVKVVIMTLLKIMKNQ